MKKPDDINALLADSLLAWYGAHARVLPWRSDPSPYRVWVSEAMLQQTRVDTVLPYFERFMSALPDVRSLAAVDDSALMKLWEGLGYYSRARNLKKAAEIVMERYGGELPASTERLRELPGIGEYMAGAVASITFGQKEPAVDGNVMRVLARALACEEDITKLETRKRFGGIVRDMLPSERPGDLNQALMDLGATVCLPNGSPHCAECPWEGLCEAHRQGGEGRLPVKEGKKPRRIQSRTVFIVRCGDRILLTRRENKGLLAGLFELPGAERWLDENEALEYLRQMGADVLSIKPAGDAKHIFTHVEWHMKGWLAEVQEFTPETEHIWADARALRDTVALPSAFKGYRKYLP